MATDLDTRPVDHHKTCPFLLRTFVRAGGFHQETAFDDGRVPTLDEHAVHVWKDSTLHDVVRSLRAQPPSPSLPAGAFRNPGTKYSFRLIFFDRGIVSSKDLGQVNPRDLNDISTLYPSVGQTPTPPTEPAELPVEDAMDADDDAPRRDRADPDAAAPGAPNSAARRTKATIRTLDELRVQPGDWLSVSIVLPAVKAAPGPGGLNIRGAGAGEREDTEAGGHWRGGGGGSGRGRPAGLVRGGGHLAFGRDRDRERERDRDAAPTSGPGPAPGRNRPPPSPPRPRDGPGPGRRGRYGRRPSPDMTRGGTSYRPNASRSRSRSRDRRSRSPVGRRRGGRYERD